jgi:uncharacterized iron-regulated membrane protein
MPSPVRILVAVHRWLGIPLSLLFVMWFASGIVMHFVPFPELTEEERFAGLPAIDLSRVMHSPAEAAAASDLERVRRVRLWQRDDGPVYLVSAAAGIKALRAGDLSAADVRSGQLALAIASAHARLRKLGAKDATIVEAADYDQWTVPNGFDQRRPLYRVALNDGAGTELYVSSRTGEVVLDTTRSERAWNYAGSVVHWIYPTVLRKDWMAWNVTVWWLSLIGIIAALSGVVVGIVRFKIVRNRLVSPYRRWHAWHHWLGMICAIFVTTWIFSGWLSMDHGRLFPDGSLSEAEADRIAGAPAWNELTPAALMSVPRDAREIEWFAFGGQIYQRERTRINAQQLSAAVPVHDMRPHAFLQAGEIDAVLSRAAAGCTNTAIVKPDGDYPVASEVEDAPVYRSICDNGWYDIDGATGAILEKLDVPRRAYRWLYRALHTLDFPVLMARPNLRAAVVVALCAFGIVFSITGVVIGWRRLRIKFYQLHAYDLTSPSPAPRTER